MILMSNSYNLKKTIKSRQILVFYTSNMSINKIKKGNLIKDAKL